MFHRSQPFLNSLHYLTNHYSELDTLNATLLRLSSSGCWRGCCWCTSNCDLQHQQMPQTNCNSENYYVHGAHLFLTNSRAASSQFIVHLEAKTRKLPLWHKQFQSELRIHVSTYFGKGIMYSKDVYSRIAVDISCIGARREIPASRTTIRVLCLSVDKSQSSDQDGHEG